MPITRINHFEAKPAEEDNLYRFLQSVNEVILTCPGCLSCRLLRGTENPAALAIIEEWDSIESHRKAASAIPTEQIAAAAKMFAKPPTGMYYRV